MGGKSTKKGKAEDAEDTSKPDEATKETSASPESEAKPTEAGETAPAPTIAPDLQARIERLEKALGGTPGEILEGQLDERIVTTDALEDRYLAPLLERIERLEQHGRLGPPPELPEALEVRTRGDRRRHVCGAGTFTRDWKVVYPKSQTEVESLAAEHKAGTLEVRRAR